MMLAKAATLFCLIVATSIQACVFKKKGAVSQNRSDAESSFDIQTPIPPDVAERIGYVAVVRLLSQSPAELRRAFTERLDLSSQPRRQSSSISMRKDDVGNPLMVGDQLTNLVFRIETTSSQVIYEGGIEPSNLTVSEGVNQISAALVCKAHEICGVGDDLRVIPASPPVSSGEATGSSGSDGTNSYPSGDTISDVNGESQTESSEFGSSWEQNIDDSSPAL